MFGDEQSRTLQPGPVVAYEDVLEPNMGQNLRGGALNKASSPVEADRGRADGMILFT